MRKYEGGKLTAQHILVIGPGGDVQLAAHKGAIASWLKSGGHLLAVGLNQRQANVFLPFNVRMKQAEHISAYFEPAGVKFPLAGIGPADVHNRDPRKIALVSEGATAVGNGVLGVAEGANVVFCQLVPWQFDYKKTQNLKRTFRRTSCLLSRLLGNMGVDGATPFLSRFSKPRGQDRPWLEGFYLDQPVEMDDPYRFFRW